MVEKVMLFRFLNLIIAASVFYSSAAYGIESRELIGQWQYSGTNEKVMIRFQENNDFSGWINDGKRIWRFSGKWNLDERVITYTYDKSEYTNAIGSVEDKDVIIKISPNALLLRDVDTGKLYPCVKHY